MQQLCAVSRPTAQHAQQLLVPAAEAAAAALHRYWALPEQAAADRLALARAAAARSCADLRCPNVSLEGGPGAGEGVGCQRCGGCAAVWCAAGAEPSGGNGSVHMRSLISIGHCQGPPARLLSLSLPCRYCGAECSRADWRSQGGGHNWVCAALGEERRAARQAAREAARQAAAS